jgi:hypothetical protein
LVAACFHVHISLVNDVIDLEVDATVPRRANNPLVKGLRGEGVSKETAIVIASAGTGGAFLLAFALGAGLYAFLALLAAFLLIGTYNAWGKLCPIPPLTDVVQGLGLWALVLFGVWVADSRVRFADPSMWPLLSFSMGFTILITGIDGGLRDLVNDMRHRKITTAIFLRARPAGGERGALQLVDGTAVESSQGVAIFSFVVLVLMFGPAAAFVREDAYFPSPAWRWMAMVSTAGVFLANAYLLWRVVKPIEPRRDTWITRHAVVLLLPSLCAYLPSSLLAAEIKWLVALLFFIPLALRSQGVERVLAHLERVGEASGSELGAALER